MFARFLATVFLFFIAGSSAYNILLVTVGHAGHVTPLFELAKSLQNHNITFVTQQVAKLYVNFNEHPNPSSFHLIFTTTTTEEMQREKEKEQDLIRHAANHSFFDSLSYSLELLNEDSNRILNTTIHQLMDEQYDLIIGNSVLKSLVVLSNKAQIPCVVQSTEVLPNFFDFNAPATYAGLNKKHMTQLVYRLYNVIFKLRLMIGISTRMIPTFMKKLDTMPRIPGPFYDAFNLKTFFSMDTHCLELYSIPATLFIVGPSDPYTKYLGAFISMDSKQEPEENEFVQWIRSKPENSIVYGAFGTSSLIHFQRMNSLVNGLIKFLSTFQDASLIFGLRGTNYDVYQNVLKQLSNEKDRTLLNDPTRVRIERGFLPQKWILQQPAVKLFISHCGMGSCSEGIFFGKPILCMPFNMDQFLNSMAIDETGVGLSLFVPPSLFESLIHPHNFQGYTFSSTNVTDKLSAIWNDPKYTKSIQLMSAEMKHAGGTKRAVEEIEYFMKLDGNLDRYLSFSMKLPFYQRYTLDLLLVLVIVPLFSIYFILKRCCRRVPKQKLD